MYVYGADGEDGAGSLVQEIHKVVGFTMTREAGGGAFGTHHVIPHVRGQKSRWGSGEAVGKAVTLLKTSFLLYHEQKT